MFGCIFLVVCLGCVWFGMTSLTRYEREPTCESSFFGESITGFLGAVLNLVAAAVSFFS